MSILKQLQARFGAAIDRELESWLAESGSSRPFTGMMEYQLGYVDAQFDRIPSGSGKRFRPALCLLAAEAVGGRWQDAVPAAAGIELLHNFSLIHDDIEDRDPARRHRPTVWKVWGEAQAINAGDGMFALASRAVLATAVPAEMALEVGRAFDETSLALTEGQYMDMSFERRQDVTADEYLDMISLKTGTLIGFSAWAGATIGGAPLETRLALRSFAEDLGKAFQIHDDVMGIWGSSDVTGKEEAKDLANRKKTLPVLLAAERASATGKADLDAFFSRTSDDVGLVLRVLDETEAMRLACEKVAFYLDRAHSWLDAAAITAPGKQDLKELARELVA